MNPTWEDPIEDDDDNSHDKQAFSGRDAVIFLIDATQEMFCTGADETPFNLSLRCARTSLTNKIISNNRDLQAIVLFGSEKNKHIKPGLAFPHIYVFQDLGEPGAERILEIEDLMSLDAVTFAENYGHSNDFLLADALWMCSLIFSNCFFKLGHKQVLLFTATDNPHDSDAQKRLQAITKAKDIFDNGIEIDLMHIQKPDSLFDVSRFYKNIIQSSDIDSGTLPNPSEKFDDLLSRVRSKDHKKRTISSIKFMLGEGLEIGISMFKLVVPTPKPTAAKLCKQTNNELINFTRTFLSDTGEVLLSSDMKKFQDIGGKRIYIDEDEMKQIRNIGEPGLQLMGFKPLSELKPHHHIRACLFAYPDEKSIAGSTRLFFTLLQRCKKREFAPICKMILRQNDAVKFVALLPQEESKDSKGIQIIPPGFHVIYQPFMEDMRNITAEPKHHPNDDLINKAKEIIKKLQFAYHPESFENPVLQKHWRNIEALALNREAPEEITDYTLPTKDIIEKRAGQLIDEFKALLCPGTEDPANADKRQMQGGYGPASKRAKIEESAIPVNLLNEASSGQLGRYKVNILKEFCKRNGIRCGSKKAEIIEAIREYYG